MSATDDYVLLERSKQAKKNEKKDEIVLTQVERINDSISRVETKLDEAESDFQKSCMYYEREIKLAEELCEREVQKLRDAMELKIQALETKRNSKVDYYLSQLSIIRAKHESRKTSLESVMERKEKRLERTARKITTSKGKEALKNEVVIPDAAPQQPTGPSQSELATERKLGQKYLQNGGSIHELARFFPNYYRELKEEEKKTEEARKNSPQARQAQIEAENMKLAHQLEQQKKAETLKQFHEIAKTAEKTYKDAKARGVTGDELDELRTQFDNAFSDYTFQKALAQGY